MGTSYRKERFFSAFGIQEDSLQHFEKSGEIRYFTILTDSETGTIRALVFEMSKTSYGFRIRCSYDVHEDNANNTHVHFLDIGCTETEDGRIQILSAKTKHADILEKIDIEDAASVKKLEQVCKEFFDTVANQNTWLNPIELMKRHGLITKDIGRKAWPGLYLTGDIKRDLKPKKSAENPMFSAFFMPALLGIAPEHYTYDGSPKIKILTHHTEENDDDFVALEYTYTQGKTPQHMHITGRVSVDNHKKGTEEDALLYEVKTAPVRKGSKKTKITHLSYEGRKIDLKDPKAVSSILKVIRNINRTVRAGDKALVEDLSAKSFNRKYALPSELMLHTESYPYLNEPINIPKAGLMDLVIVGGNPFKRLVSDQDLNIGANQYVISYRTKQPDGSIKTEAGMIDAGILFHDVFDVAFYNASRFLYHEFDKSRAPDTPVDFILITHKHEDHLGQLPYLVKAGYKLPPLIMNEMTYLSLQRKMKELKIEKALQDQVLKQCYKINMQRDVNPANPTLKKKTTISNTVIEQSTEVLPGKKLGRYEHYPLLQVGSFKIRIGPMPHSDPGFMYDLITPAGSIRHTGDYNRDKTNPLGLPDNDIWLQGYQPDVMTADSTGANREEPNPPESAVGDDIIKIVNAHEGQRMIFPMLGSNISRLATTIRALSQTECKTLIISGKAVKDLVTDADKVHDFRAWAKRLGVTILMDTQKEAKALLRGESEKRYGILATGTQDEPQSAMNKLVRDVNDKFCLTDDDVVCYLQGVIPVGKNKWHRINVKETLQFFHGAKVYMPENVVKEGELTIRHTSGHSSAPDCIETIQLSGLPFVIPVHGGPDQINAHMALATKAGAQTLRATSNSRIRISKGKKASIIGNVLSSLVGIKLHSPNGKFWLKGRFSTAVIAVKPPAFTEAGSLTERFENALLHSAGFSSENALASSLPFFLSPRFNVVSGNGYLSQNFPFGVERYKKSNVFEDKEIHIVAGFDTETTGKAANDNRIHEFGLIVHSTEKRKPIEKIQLKQKIPDYIIPSPQAMLVTGLSYQDLKSGQNAAAFTKGLNDNVDSLKALAQQLAKQKHRQDKSIETKKNRMKVLVVAHNKPFDQRMIEKELGRNLHARLKPFETYGLIGLDTRNVSRALAAYVPDKYKPNKYPNGIIDDHRLSSLCDALGIKYNGRKLHGALVDTKLAMDLFWAQYDLAPDLVGQMVINADTTNYHLLNDMMGMATGFDGPHPIFSYVSPSALQPAPKMGCLIATLSDDRYAIVFNLKFDPYEYLSKSPEEILSLAENRENEVFELIDLKNNPIVVPAQFGFKVGAHNGMSKETLDYRAGVVKRYRNFLDPDANWQNIADKLSAQYDENKTTFFQEQQEDEFPDLSEKIISLAKRGARPEKGIPHLMGIRKPGATNNAHKSIARLLKSYVTAIENDDSETISETYQSLMGYRSILDKSIITINNVHYDIAPDDMSEHDHQQIKQMRKYISHYQYLQAVKEVNNINENQEEFNYYIGRSTKKRKLFKDIQQWINDNKHLAYMDDDMRDFAAPHRTYNPIHQMRVERHLQAG